MKEDARSKRASQQGLAVVSSEESPVGRRIVEGPVRPADDEVARQADPRDGQPEPPADLQLDDREADGQPDPALDDAIEEAVRRLGELGRRRTAKPDLAIEDVMEHIDRPLWRIASIETGGDALGEAIEADDRRGGIEARSIVRGDEQGADRQIDVRVGAGDETGEPGSVRRTGHLPIEGRLWHRRDCSSSRLRRPMIRSPSVNPDPPGRRSCLTLSRPIAPGLGPSGSRSPACTTIFRRHLSWPSPAIRSPSSGSYVWWLVSSAVIPSASMM